MTIKIKQRRKTAIEKKKKLLRMKKGEPRPKQDDALGSALSRYTSNSKDYDKIFDKQIRKRHPNWFPEFIRTKNKKKLLRIKTRPTGPTPLGSALVRYTCKSSGGAYDPKFDELIRKKHPDWFINTATENKKKLLQVKEGEPRPKNLGPELSQYICKSGAYDPKFDEQIRKKHPDWFRKYNYKKLLLQMKKGEQRPKQSKDSPLYSLALALSRFTCKNSSSYDPKFDKQIRKLHPDWFKKPESVDEKKKELLQIKKGEHKDQSRAKLIWEQHCHEGVKN